MRHKEVLHIGIAAIVVGATLALGGCAAGGTSSSDEHVLRIGTPEIVQKWDPHAEDGGTFLQPLQAAYDTLIRKNEDGTFSEALATSWSYPTPTTFSLKLREGVTFSDGTPFDAEAVKANFDSAAEQIGPKTSLIQDWTSVDVISDDEVQITTATPDPSLPLVLSQNQGMMVSPKALADHSSLDQVPVGAGPFTLDTANTVANDHYTFVRNESYWDNEATGFDKIVFTVYTDATAMFNALQSGQIDAAPGDAENVQSAEAAGLTVESYLSFFMGLNLQGQTGDLFPPIKDVRVRQAIQYAVDRDELQATIGDGSPTTQIFPEGTEGYDPALDDAYPHDVDKAKELLAEAGYPDGIDLTATTFEYQFFSRYGQALQAQLAEAGIRLELKNVQSAEYFSNRNGADNPIYIWYYNPVNAYYDAKQIILPDGSFNPFAITDDTLISLFDEAAAEPDEAERTKIYQQMSKRFVEQSYDIITNYGNAYYFVNDKVVSNMEPTTLESRPFIYGLQPTE